jgi:hypothetical protein
VKLISFYLKCLLHICVKIFGLVLSSVHCCTEWGYIVAFTKVFTI